MSRVLDAVLFVGVVGALFYIALSDRAQAACGDGCESVSCIKGSGSGTNKVTKLENSACTKIVRTDPANACSVGGEMSNTRMIHGVGGTWTCSFSGPPEKVGKATCTEEPDGDYGGSTPCGTTCDCT